MKLTRVLVCGGRDFSDSDRMDRVMNYVQCNVRKLGGRSDQLQMIITGGARGADKLAEEWADKAGIPCRIFMAEWGKYGKRAGLIRNQQMLIEGKPHMVVAFPGGRGTADMVGRARDAGIKIIIVRG